MKMRVLGIITYQVEHCFEVKDNEDPSECAVEADERFLTLYPDASAVEIIDTKEA